MIMKKRFAAAVMLLVLFFALLSSFGFIIIESNHECLGEDCPICYKIAICENTLKTIVFIAPALVFSILTKRFSSVIFECKRDISVFGSLVSLKVKLSN